MGHFIMHILGMDNLSGPWYGFWSGFGSDVTEFGLVIAMWHNINCHEKRCWRPGRRINGSVICYKHRKKGTENVNS